MTQRPRRKRKDVLLSGRGDPDPNAQAMWYALGPLDETARQMEIKWGVDRLPALVSEQTAMNFGAVRDDLDDAIDRGDVTAVGQFAAELRRGWIALDAEATAADARPYNPEAWAFEIGGKIKAAIVRDNASVPAVAHLDGECTIYTLEEIGNLLTALFRSQAPAIAEAKRLWPGAAVNVVSRPPQTAVGKLIDDEIPF